MYASKPGDYYRRQIESPGLRGMWFRTRQKTTAGLVKKYFKGGLIVDIGCGNCLWDSGEVPVIGIDICEAMLEYNTANIRSFLPLKSDVTAGLPLKDSSVDVIVITELLEHFTSYGSLLKEVSRVLKKGGVIIGSVPYGEFPGIWSFIFPLWCKYRAWKDSDNYYLNRCGHKMRFNAGRLRAGLADFNILEVFGLYYLTLFFVARKE